MTSDGLKELTLFWGGRLGSKIRARGKKLQMRLSPMWVPELLNVCLHTKTNRRCNCTFPRHNLNRYPANLLHACTQTVKSNPPKDLYSTDKLITLPAIWRSPFLFFFTISLTDRPRLAGPWWGNESEDPSQKHKRLTEKRLGLFCYSF